MACFNWFQYEIDKICNVKLIGTIRPDEKNFSEQPGKRKEKGKIKLLSMKFMTLK